MEYRIIDRAHSEDIRTKNEPFPLFGRLIPTYSGEKWEYSVHRSPEGSVSEMCFPDENYDYEALSADHVFLGAYDGEKCVGLAIMKDDWFKYMYLEDLKVSREYRRRGIGKMLMEKAMEIAHARNYNGIYAVGQDNNLGACLFYLKTGFEIGGFDNRVYRGTSQEDKANIFFYRDK